MTTPVLQVLDISRSFTSPAGQHQPILHHLSLEVCAGEIVCIRGRSGSGKSTMLNLLGLIDTPDEGRILVGGRDTTRLGSDAKARLRGETLGFVFQQFHLVAGKTARENVAEPLLFGTARERRERTERAEALLKSVGLGHRMDQKPSVLSGGEQQRVAIARALARSPQLLLADEPTGSLDVDTGARVMDVLIEQVRSRGASLVLVTHDEVIAKRADRMLILEQGRLVES